MRVLLVTEFVRVMEWSPSVWAGVICRGLLDRGHEVTLLADGVEDVRAFHSAGRSAALVVRRPTRIARTRDPLGFQRWARAEMGRRGESVGLSLTRLAPAAVWMPTEPPSRDEFLGSVRSGSAATVVLEALARPWILSALRAERRAMRMAGAMGTSPRGHEPASALAPLGPDARERARTSVRTRLGLEQTHVVVLISAMDSHWSTLRGFLGGMAQLKSASKDRRVCAIVLSREAHSIGLLAERLGVASRVRLMSGTIRMPELFAASDVACVTGGSSGGTGRFLADAVRCERPVLAAAGATGAPLLEPGAFGTSPLGLVTGDLTPAGWRRLLEEAAEPQWMRSASRAARDVGPSLGMDRFLDRLERDLLAAGEGG